jgi:hypothetical protein
MDILKVIFEHDMTLEHLSDHDDPRNRNKSSGMDRDSALAALLSPQRTYCRYYLSGTLLSDPVAASSSGTGQQAAAHRFGLAALSHWPQIRLVFGLILDAAAGDATAIQRLEAHFLQGQTPTSGTSNRLPTTPWHFADGRPCSRISEAIASLAPGDILISGAHSESKLRQQMVLDDRTGVRERFEPLTKLLDQDHLVLLTEKAHHGYDLHLFSRRNLYEVLFYGCQAMLKPGLRCFTINGKRVASERHFYFETWSLDRPPHGFQEVTADSRLR